MRGLKETTREPLSFVLVEPSASEGPLTIRMMPKPEYGGALVSIGPTTPVSWVTIQEFGLSAFDPLYNVNSDSEENVDLAPGKGRLRHRKTVDVDIDSGTIVLSPGRRKAGRPIGARDEDRIRLKLPISGHDLEKELKEALVRAQ